MQIKLDECVPTAAARSLLLMGHDVHTVREEGLNGSPDDAVWKAAQLERRFLITTDLDFSNVRQYRPGSHAGVLLLRLKDEGLSSMTRFLEWLFANHDIQKWSECFVVASDHKVRVRKV